MTNMTKQEFEAYIERELAKCDGNKSTYSMTSYGNISELVLDRYTGDFYAIIIENLEFAMTLLKECNETNTLVTLSLKDRVWTARIGKSEYKNEFIGYAIVGAWLKWKGL